MLIRYSYEYGSSLEIKCLLYALQSTECTSHAYYLHLMLIMC